MYRVLFAVFRYQAATTALFSARHTGLSMSESVGPFVLKMVRFISSKGQNVQIPGAGTSAVPRTDDFLAVPNLTAHPSTASVPITVLMCNSPLLCCFNVPIKGFNLPGEPEEPIVLGDNDTSLSSSSSL